MIIFLADLQNSYYRYLRNSIPIGMGYVAAYLKKRFGDNVDIYLFRKFEELYEKSKEIEPDLVAFGSYCWNTSLTLKTAQFIRNRYPKSVIAVGGPDVSPLFHIINQELLNNKQVDFYLPNEGEMPTANIVEALLGRKDQDEIRDLLIKGCFSVKRDTNQILGEALSRFDGDINEIPSPYFGGLMDRFLSDIDYMPSIQTSRGCPYRCTYCVSGKETWSAIRPFDICRVKEEIDYVAKRSRNSFLRFSDENLGILPRDKEIVEYLIKKRKETGFPQSGSIYTDKYPTEQVKKICLLMREIIPFCMSFQSLTPKVLKNIKRVNLTNQEVTDAIRFARKNNLIPVSELIFPLPGETVDSFLSSINKLIEYRFESIEIQPLHILKGTEMDTPEDRVKYDVKTMFSMAENGYTKHTELENIEIDEWVVANNTLTEEDYFKTLRFIFLFDFAHYRSYLKELLFFFECYGISAAKLLIKIIEHRDICPLLFESADSYEVGIRSFLHRSPEQAIEDVRRKIVNNDSLFGFYELRKKLDIDILMNNKFSQAVEEMVSMGKIIFKEMNGTLSQDFKEELEVIKSLVLNAFIPLHHRVPKRISIISKFDLELWIYNNYDRPLFNYRLTSPREFIFEIRGFSFYEAIWEMKEDNFTKYKKASLVFTSANRRRALVKSSEVVSEGRGGS